jgi:hypothetical protein
MLSNEQLAEIRERLENATPGPWYCHPNHATRGETFCVGNDPKYRSGPIHCQNRPDAELAAHAPADIAALLDFVRELKEEIQEMDYGLGFPPIYHEQPPIRLDIDGNLG